MPYTDSQRIRFFSATAIAIAMVGHSASLAQENENPEPEATEAEFLGTLTLGESKRTVQTETATPLTVIDQTEIDDRQASTVAELIDSVPGVTLVNGSTPSGSGINIRGFGANSTFGSDQKVAIIVDGANTGSEELYRIGTQLFTDPYLYKQVEVIRGTIGSFEYGSGIIGGVVKLDTKDASDFTGGEPGLKAALTVGGYSNTDGLNGSAIIAWQPTRNLELLANYAYREQGFQDDGDGNEIGNSEFELPSFLLKGRYSFGVDNAHSIMASYTNSEANDRDVPYDTFLTSDGGFGNADRDTKSETASLFYNYNPLSNDLLDLTASITYANQEIDQTYIEGSSPLERFFPIAALVGADHKYETTRATLKNTAFFETGSIFQEWRTGIELIRKERADANSAPGGEDDRYGLFVVGNVDFGNGFSLAPALRFESSEVTGTLNDGSNVSYENDALMGGLSARYAFGDGFAVFTSYAHTENLPILDDLENAVFMEQPEVADTFEIGASYDRIGIFNDGDALAIKVNYYDTTLDDVTSYSDVSEVSIQGIELEGSFALENGFYIDLNANFTEGDEERGTGQTVDWRNAPADSYRLTGGRRFGSFADLSVEVVSAEDTVRSTLSQSGERQTVETEGFLILNARATITPQAGPLEGVAFRLGLENAFDEQFTPLLATRPAPGQNFKLTVSKVF